MDQKQIDKMTSNEVRAAVRTIYDSQCRQDNYEPKWIAMFWASAYENTGDVAEYRRYLKSVAKSPHLATRMMGVKHVQEDGFLVATTSWIFAGRKMASPVEYRGWIIIDRDFSQAVKTIERANGLGTGQPTRFFMAYSARGPVGVSAMTGDEIGPCTSLAEVKGYIDDIATDDDGPEGDGPGLQKAKSELSQGSLSVIGKSGFGKTVSVLRRKP
jgi:hypothetical protein